MREEIKLHKKINEYEKYMQGFELCKLNRGKSEEFYDELHIKIGCEGGLYAIIPYAKLRYMQMSLHNKEKCI